MRTRRSRDLLAADARASDRRSLAGRTLAPFLAVLLVLVAACATAPPRADAGPRSAQSVDAAAAQLTDALVAKAEPASGRRTLVIDPLIDRASGAETAATRSIGAGIADQVRGRHPRLSVRPFTTAGLSERPIILLGSIAGVAAAGSVEPAVGKPRVYRVWAVLADLGSNRVLGREMVWGNADDVDPRPTAAFRDAPVWTPDPVAAACIRTCSSAAGTPVDPVYLEALRAQAVLADAVSAYDAGRYRQARAGYERALGLAGDRQLRAFSGHYMADRALGRRTEAERDFARLVDHGLGQGRLATKLLFRPGSTMFWPDRAVSGAYPMWLRQIARLAAARDACLDISGHTSPTDPAENNERLSRARAERVRNLLAEEEPSVAAPAGVRGAAAQETIIGTGADDASDALDRRVEFRPLACA